MQSHVLIIHSYPSEYLIEQVKKVAGDISLIVPKGFQSEVINLVKNIVFADLNDNNILLSEAKKIHEKSAIDAILPIYEGAAVVNALISSELGLPHLSVSAARLSRDKLASQSCWSDAGLPVPKTFSIKKISEPNMAWEADLSYPIIVKPVDAMSSQGVVKVHNRNEFYEALSTITQHLNNTENINYERNFYQFGRFEDKVIVQEFCSGEEVGIDLFTTESNAVSLGIFQKANAQGPHFPESLSVSPSCFCDEIEKKLFELAVKAVRSLGLIRGVAHVEIRMTENGPKILEAGLRPGGAYTAPASEALYGISTIEVQTRIYLRLPIPHIERKHSRAVLYGGVLYPNSGELAEIKGLDVFEKIDDLIEMKQLNQLGDEVCAMPNSSQPHLLYYLFSSPDRETALKIHHHIQKTVIPVVIKK